MKDISTGSLSYYIYEAVHSLILSRGRAVVAIVTIGFSLFLLGIYFLISLNFSLLIHRWQEEIHLEVFLTDDLTLPETESLEKRLRSRSEIQEVTYCSKSEAWDNFKTQGYEHFIEGLSTNPLPASFQLRLKADYRTIPEIRLISQELLKIPGIDDVTSGIDLVEKLEVVSHFIHIAGLFVGLLVLIASIFIISNTIKLSLYTRIDEIDIMKLVGSTNSFIMLPFVIEGVIQGLTGSLAAISLLYAGFELFVHQARTDELLVLGLGTLSFMSLWQGTKLVVFGITIGFFGSYFSVSQFLRPTFSRRI